jgi:hypothetical protein
VAVGPDQLVDERIDVALDRRPPRTVRPVRSHPIATTMSADARSPAEASRGFEIGTS